MNQPSPTLWQTPIDLEAVVHAGRIVVVQDPIDAEAMRRHRFPETIASCGPLTAGHALHLATLRSDTLLAYIGTPTWSRQAIADLDALQEGNLHRVRVARLFGKPPAETLSQIDHRGRVNRGSISADLSNALDAWDFRVEQTMPDHPRRMTSDERWEAVLDLTPALLHVPRPIREIRVGDLARKLKIPVRVIRDHLAQTETSRQPTFQD